MYINQNNIDANGVNQGREYVNIQTLLYNEEFSKVRFGDIDIVHAQTSEEDGRKHIDLVWSHNVDKYLAMEIENILVLNKVAIDSSNSNDLKAGVFNQTLYEEDVKDNILIQNQHKSLQILGNALPDDMKSLYHEDIAEAEARHNERIEKCQQLSKPDDLEKAQAIEELEREKAYMNRKTMNI